MNKYRFPALIVLMSILYIFGIPTEPQAVKIVFKLIPMWLIIVYAYMQLPSPKRRSDWALLIGLFFCMLGDGLLRWFVIGLSAFLIGHLFYMMRFSSRWRFSKLRFVTIVPIALYGSFMGREIVHALIRDSHESLIVPVLLYISVISLMMWTAIMTGHRWAIIGSLLFTISDSILSWNMFVSDVTFSGPLIMTTYYTAQFCMAHSLKVPSARFHQKSSSLVN